ncbi:uncharacterized protein LOC128271140 [Anopheles cruzii]|uniref:uncharacterized protein LOC128271140 n=1 Tax=Anopheles cruzii TaxID=68878 RepID=UPI0022EC6D81|nr:uncharacterized protein LOC128271140 [Anopheles cruzii]
MVEETTLNDFISSTTETLRIITRQLGMIANSVDELVTGMSAGFNGLREEVRATLASTWNDDLQSTSDPPEALARPFSHSFLPVKTEDDLRNLEVAAAGDAFVTDAKEHFLSKYPYERYQGNGRTVLLRLIDDFFTRHFISGCLWTGFSVTDERKIAFRKYRETLRLLSILVQQSDPTYSYERCAFDLKNLLQRASKRSTRVLRVPSARRNFKPKKGKENMDNASVT